MCVIHVYTYEKARMELLSWAMGMHGHGHGHVHIQVEYEKARMELLSWAMGMKAANLGVLLKARDISMDQVWPQR